MHQHGHKVNETRKRSIAKAIFGRIIEITIGGIIFGIILTILGFPHAFEMGFGLNILEECICLIVTVFTERIWNKIDWGREVTDTKNCVKS